MERTKNAIWEAVNGPSTLVDFEGILFPIKWWQDYQKIINKELTVVHTSHKLYLDLDIDIEIRDEVLDVTDNITYEVINVDIQYVFWWVKDHQVAYLIKRH